MYLLLKEKLRSNSKIRVLFIPKCIDANAIRELAMRHYNVIGTITEMEWHKKSKYDCIHAAEYVSPDLVLCDKNCYTYYAARKNKEPLILGDYYVVDNMLTKELISELLKLWDHYDKNHKKTPTETEMLKRWNPLIKIIKTEDFATKIMIHDIIT